MNVYKWLECKLKGHRWKIKQSIDLSDTYYYKECEICGRTELIGFHK